jgi:cell division protein FtsQ
VRKAAIILGCLFLVGVVVDLAASSAPIQAAANAARDGLFRLAADRGLRVARIVPEGQVRTDGNAVNQMLAQYKYQNILSVELEEIRSRLERLPWVREASVARELPGTLRVRVVEHRPVARWKDRGRQVLVSETGEVIPVPGLPRYHNLPLLLGKGAPERAGEILRILARQPSLRSRVAYAALVGERRWNIHLDGSVEVRLPEEEPEKAWARLAVQHRRTGLLGRAIKSVDLRHSAWLSLELADELSPFAKEPGA